MTRTDLPSPRVDGAGKAHRVMAGMFVNQAKLAHPQLTFRPRFQTRLRGRSGSRQGMTLPPESARNQQ